MILYLNIVALTIFALFSYKRLRHYLHIFQQEEYDNKRFFSWLVATVSVDKRLSASIIVIFLGVLFVPANLSEALPALLIATAFIIFSLLEVDPTKTAKKKLVITKRAKAILLLAWSISIVMGIIVVAFNLVLLWLIPIQLLPLTLICANLLLSPIEKARQKGYLKEALGHLAIVDPTIIGITGSFGKTSTKLILGHILELYSHTLFTPGSVNTLMGITRVIRENLKRNCRYFLVEMGAYGKGSIKELCELTEPDVGIITSLGEAHYERFQSLESVAKAKFELAEATLKNLGKIIVTEQVLTQQYASTFIKKHRDKFLIVGEERQCDLRILEIRQKTNGIHVDIEWKSTKYNLFAPLFGRHHGVNIAVSFCTAASLGIPEETIVIALKTTPQVNHRLKVKKSLNGVTYIDDAYNSNPLGFGNALDILSLLGCHKGGRKIIVTPGMAELGEKHDQAHAKLGSQTSNTVDVAIIVCPNRIPSFVDAIRSSQRNIEILEVDSFSKAEKWLVNNTRHGDVVLLENDLPDLYETKFRT